MRVTVAALTPLDTSDDEWTHFPFADRYDRNIAQIALDSNGLIWLASHDLKDNALDWNSLTVLDPGGTPTDLSDDRWGRFPVLTGFLPSKVFNLALDAQGLVWVGTTDGMFVLDSNGTPFDPDDDAVARRGTIDMSCYDIGGSVCEPDIGPEGNPDLDSDSYVSTPPETVGRDGLSVIYLGDDLSDKSDDVVINL